MSRRTSEASKAIRLAWQREQELVQEGKGTRDWTEEQQQDIIVKGKAYDENGKAFEGHHMKSAEAFPEYQGEPDNIQFLTRLEHFDAHNGSFQNPTNGFYDSISKETFVFESGEYEPCKIIELSNPITNTSIRTIDNKIEDSCSNTPVQSETIDTGEVKKESRVPDSSMLKSSNTAKSVAAKNIVRKETPGFFRRVAVEVVDGVKKAWNIVYNHRKLIGALVVGGIVATGKIINDISSDGENVSNNNDFSTPIDTDSNHTCDENISCSVDSSDSDISFDHNDDETDSGSKGTPKSPHIRKGHPHHYWTNGERVEKWIDDIQVHKEQMDDDSE